MLATTRKQLVFPVVLSNQLSLGCVEKFFDFGIRLADGVSASAHRIGSWTSLAHDIRRRLFPTPRTRSGAGIIYDEQSRSQPHDPTFLLVRRVV
jgi:hypothetical protein